MDPLESCSEPWHQKLHTVFLSQLLPSQQRGQPCLHTSHKEQEQCVTKQMLYL